MVAWPRKLMVFPMAFCGLWNPRFLERVRVITTAVVPGPITAAKARPNRIAGNDSITSTNRMIGVESRAK